MALLLKSGGFPVRRCVNTIRADLNDHGGHLENLSAWTMVLDAFMIDEISS